MEYKYQGLTLEFPFNVYSVLDYRLVEQNDKHTRLFLSCIIPDEEKDKLVEDTKATASVKVMDKDLNYIFQGTVSNIKFKKHGENYSMDLEVVSYSKQLDLKLKSRSFMDLNLTYEDIIKEVLKDYPKADYLDKATNGKKIDDILVQYKETDFDFLIRIASHFNAPLIVDAKDNSPRVYIGEPNLTIDKAVPIDNIVSEKNLIDYLDTITNFQGDLDEFDAIFFTFECAEKFELGNRLRFKEQSYVVTYAETYTKGSELHYKYKIYTLDGTSTNYMENKNIIGAQLQGTIKEIKRNTMRIHLDIDKVYKGANNKFIPYSGGINNELGYYMPKIGSKVNLYFPDGEEKNAVVVDSVRQNLNIKGSRRVAGEDRMQDPREKHLRNEFGKEMRLGVNDLEFTTGNDGIKVNLSSDGVATIHSSKSITIASEGDMHIGYRYWDFKDKELIEKNKPAKKIHLKAEEIYIKQGDEENIEKGIILGENAAIFTNIDDLIIEAVDGVPSLEDPAPDFEKEEKKKQAEDKKILENAKRNAKIRKEKQDLTKADLKALFVGIMAMQTSIEAVGEMNPQLAKDLASGMGELAEEMEKVLNGDKEAEEHLLNTLFGGDKKAFDRFRYTFVISAQVMAESWGQILNKDDLSKSMKLIDKLLNGNGLDKDLVTAYTAFSKSALASGLIGDFEKKLEEVIKEPS
ncbi:MAG: contractile injection system protein, VgrG/Pvc8 family, partial [Oscillospiraceae bacterium]|nr:contractile injection system protein, VgrG/Pvc8 family [Oscillospiraceae bacterium]